MIYRCVDFDSGEVVFQSSNCDSFLSWWLPAIHKYGFRAMLPNEIHLDYIFAYYVWVESASPPRILLMRVDER
jgi:hypothetical protein